MPFYERGPVRIHYEEAGSGFPLLLIPGGGLNSALASWQTASPFNPMRHGRETTAGSIRGLEQSPGVSNRWRSSGGVETNELPLAPRDATQTRVSALRGRAHG